MYVFFVTKSFSVDVALDISFICGYNSLFSTYGLSTFGQLDLALCKSIIITQICFSDIHVLLSIHRLLHKHVERDSYGYLFMPF